MSPTRLVRQYVEDMIDAIDKATEFTRGMSYEQFAADAKTTYAVTRALEILGEAAKQFPPTIREQYPEAPWREMAGIRDRLIHGYARVSSKVLWKTVWEDLPPLLVVLQRMLAERHEE